MSLTPPYCRLCYVALSDNESYQYSADDKFSLEYIVTQQTPNSIEYIVIKSEAAQLSLMLSSCLTYFTLEIRLWLG